MRVRIHRGTSQSSKSNCRLSLQVNHWLASFDKGQRQEQHFLYHDSVMVQPHFTSPRALWLPHMSLPMLWKGLGWGFCTAQAQTCGDRVKEATTAEICFIVDTWKPKFASEHKQTHRVYLMKLTQPSGYFSAKELYSPMTLHMRTTSVITPWPLRPLYNPVHLVLLLWCHRTLSPPNFPSNYTPLPSSPFHKKTQSLMPLLREKLLDFIPTPLLHGTHRHHHISWSIPVGLILDLIPSLHFHLHFFPQPSHHCSQLQINVTDFSLG